MEAKEIVRSTAEPAFATDERGRLVLCNDAAAELLRRPPSELLGKPCHEIIRGSDLFGNLQCAEICSLHDMVRRKEAVHDFELNVTLAGERRQRVAVSIVVVPGGSPGRYVIVHILRPAPHAEIASFHPRAASPHEGDGSDRRGVAAEAGSPLRFASLTSREREILDLMAEGAPTLQIAESLCISSTTVRNHIQHILRKLDVHTKVQAVSLALRRAASS